MGKDADFGVAAKKAGERAPAVKEKCVLAPVLRGLPMPGDIALRKSR